MDKETITALIKLRNAIDRTQLYTLILTGLMIINFVLIYID